MRKAQFCLTLVSTKSDPASSLPKQAAMPEKGGCRFRVKKDESNWRLGAVFRRWQPVLGGGAPKCPWKGAQPRRLFFEFALAKGKTWEKASVPAPGASIRAWAWADGPQSRSVLRAGWLLSRSPCSPSTRRGPGVVADFQGQRQTGVPHPTSVWRPAAPAPPTSDPDTEFNKKM